MAPENNNLQNIEIRAKVKGHLETIYMDEDKRYLIMRIKG